jgi:hypothetical protein
VGGAGAPSSPGLGIGAPQILRSVGQLPSLRAWGLWLATRPALVDRGSSEVRQACKPCEGLLGGEGLRRFARQLLDHLHDSRRWDAVDMPAALVLEYSPYAASTCWGISDMWNIIVSASGVDPHG